MRQRQHVGTDLLGELFERLKLFLVHQLEFGDEVVKVLVACVDVRLRTCNKDVILSLYFLRGAERFLADFHQAVEMMNVDVYKHPVQTC